MAGSCSELVQQFGQQVQDTINGNLSYATSTVYYYQRSTVQANAAKQDDCYFNIDKGFVMVLNVNITATSYVAETQSHTIAPHSMYVAGQINTPGNTTNPLAIYQTGMAFIATNTTFAQTGKPVVTSMLHDVLTGPNYTMPDQLVSYAAIGGVNFSDHMPKHDGIIGYSDMLEKLEDKIL
ncbi:hypothetical protein BZG36_05697 [Bifiguratus adelaidae]|uniref:Uncharacterized protein n=1 Tax=Bifiguratus adelaidae TaxID=1938954 RepID=A0A261XU00_9FUNG|nr:hypothetical protein BZG36_05697 [Bifiguratus adelaidae]